MRRGSISQCRTGVQILGAVPIRALAYFLTEEQTIEITKVSLAKYFAQAEAIKRLRARGFKINLYASQIVIDDAERARLYSLLMSEANARGGSTLFHQLVNLLEGSWWSEFQRYVVNLNIHSSPPKSAPSLPIGYLYNIAAKIASLGIAPGAPTMPDPEFFSLAIDICAMHGVEPYNWAEVSIQSGNGLIELLGDLGRFHFAFTLPQLDERDVVRTLRAAFSWVDSGLEARLGWSLEQALVFCESIIGSLAAKGAISISRARLRATVPSIPPPALDALWVAFVHRPATVNTSFCNPMDASSANGYFKPLLGFADDAAIGLRSVSVTGWYEALATSLREAGVSDVDQQIGDAFEPFVRDCLAPYGTVYSGKFESPSGHGDVDAAFATDSTIVLFELKKKALTRGAQSGDIISVLLDLIKSVVKAQSQLGKVEYILRKEGSLMLGPDLLELNNREIKRIVLSWHDYGVFHDRSFLGNFLQKLSGSSITSTDPGKADDVESINKQLAELADWERKIAPLRANVRIPFDSCLFYAIGHLLTMMRSSKTDKELCRHLLFNEYVRSVTLDFYVEYGRWLRDILPSLPPPT